MATRPDENTSQGFRLPGVVKAGQSVTKGRGIKRNSDGTFQTAGAGEQIAGWPLHDAAAGEIFSYFAPNGSVIVAVKVGTGGATAGKNAVAVADGVTDAAPHGGGTTAQNICGEFTQTGVVGDLCGLRIFTGFGVKA